MNADGDLIPVVVNDDLVVWHTQAEYDRLWAGVDREAIEGLADVPDPDAWRKRQELAA